MKNSTKAIFAVATAVTSTSALAHDGHDHGANVAMLSHVLFYGSIAAAISVVAFFAIKYFQSTK